jgi:MFS family permease
VLRPVGTAGTTVARVRVRPGDLRVLVELLPIAPWAFGVVSVTLAVLPGLMRPLVPSPVLYSGFVIFVSLTTGVLAQPFVAQLGRYADLWGLGVAALGILLGAHAVAVASPALVFAVAPLVGFGYGVMMTAGLAEVSARVPPQARGTAVGIYYVLTYVGFGLPFAHAKLAKGWGDRGTLLATAGLAAVCLVVRASVELGARRRRA